MSCVFSESSCSLERLEGAGTKGIQFGGVTTVAQTRDDGGCPRMVVSWPHCVFWKRSKKEVRNSGQGEVLMVNPETNEHHGHRGWQIKEANIFHVF